MADKSGGWKTINGVHVFIDGKGTITKGPAKFIGKTTSDLSNHVGDSPAAKAFAKVKADRKQREELSKVSKGAKETVAKTKASMAKETDPLKKGNSATVTELGVAKKDLAKLSDKQLQEGLDTVKQNMDKLGPTSHLKGGEGHEEHLAYGKQARAYIKEAMNRGLEVGGTNIKTPKSTKSKLSDSERAEYKRELEKLKRETAQKNSAMAIDTNFSSMTKDEINHNIHLLEREMKGTSDPFQKEAYDRAIFQATEALSSGKYKNAVSSGAPNTGNKAFDNATSVGKIAKGTRTNPGRDTQYFDAEKGKNVSSEMYKRTLKNSSVKELKNERVAIQFSMSDDTLKYKDAQRNTKKNAFTALNTELQARGVDLTTRKSKVNTSYLDDTNIFSGHFKSNKPVKKKK